MDTAYLNLFTQQSMYFRFELRNFADVSVCYLEMRVEQIQGDGVYVLDMDTSASLDLTEVAHLSASSTSAKSSINCQYSSLNSSILTSVSLVTQRFDRTADTAHRRSTSLPNMSLTEFHLVLQDLMS